MKHFFRPDDKLQWIISLRYHAVLGQLVAIVVGYNFLVLNTESLRLALSVSVLLVCFNILIHRQKVVSKQKEISQKMLFVQLAIDLLSFTLLLLIVGVAAHPFYILYAMHIIIGAILLKKRWSFIFLFLTLLFLSFNQALFLLKNSLNLPDIKYNFVIQYFVCLASWWIVRSLSLQLDRENQRIKHMEIFTEKTRRLRAIGALAAGFSHEFASPLNTAKLRIDRIKRVSKDAPIADDAKEAGLAIGNCVRILKSMHEASVSSEETFVSVSLNQIVREIIKNWRSGRADIQVEFAEKIVPNLDLPVVSFAQAFTNVLNNADEATLGSGLVAVEISSSAEHVSLKVFDEGSGFDDGVMERIGEPFNTAKANGTGLGFYTAQLFMQSVDGELVVHKPILGVRKNCVEMRFRNLK